MPAIDSCEPQIIQALSKQGWTITDQPYAIRISPTDGYVFADLKLEQIQSNESAIVVEVKCFPENRSALDEFYHAVGQYMVYREALRLNGIDVPVFLAIPTATYDSLFQKTVVQAIVKGSKIKLIVIDLERKEVVLWTN